MAANASGEGYLNDVAQAWAAAEEVDETAVHRMERAPLVAREVRCALTTATIRGLSSDISGPLLAALVAHNVWDPSVALSAALQPPWTEGRDLALQALAPVLPAALLEKALAVARSGTPADSYPRAVVALALRLPEPRRSDLLREAIPAGAAIEWPASRVGFYVDLAPLLVEPDRSAALARALDATWQLQTDSVEGDLQEALRTLAPLLPEALLERALAEARTRGVSVLERARLVRHLPAAAARAEAQALLTEVGERQRWLLPDVWQLVLPKLVDPHDPAVLSRALAQARAWSDATVRAGALIAVVELFTESPVSLVEEALSTTRLIDDPFHRARVLTQLAGHAPDPLRRVILAEALAAALRTEPNQPFARPALLAAIVPLLSEPERTRVLEEALGAARAIDDGVGLRRVEHLVDLALLAPPPRRADILREALAATREIPYVPHLQRALAALAPHLSEPLAADALDLVEHFLEPAARAYALGLLAPRLSPSHLAEALVVARQTGADDAARAALLAVLAPHCPVAVQAEVLNAAVSIGQPGERAEALFALGAQPVPGALQAEALDRALIAAAEVQRSDRSRQAAARVLLRWAPRLPEPWKTRALKDLLALLHWEGSVPERELSWIEPRLPAAIPHLPEPLLRDALSKVNLLGLWWLEQLAPHLPQVLLLEAVALVHAWWPIQDAPHYLARALAALIPHLPPATKQDLLIEALYLAGKLEPLAQERGSLLAALAPDLAPSEIERALILARACTNVRGRATALAALGLRLSDPMQQQVLVEALAAAGAVERDWDRAEMAIGMARTLPYPWREQALRIGLAAVGKLARTLYTPELTESVAVLLPDHLLAEAIDTIRNLPSATFDGARGQCRALRGLAAYLPEPLAREALGIARAVPFEEPRAEATAALLARLAELGTPDTAAGLLQLASSLEPRESRSQALAALVGRVAALPRDRLYPLWRATLHVGAARSRTDMLADLRDLVPLVLALDSVEAPSAIARVVLDL